MKLEDSALIEDFSEDIVALWDIGLDGIEDVPNMNNLVDPFCITGPSVLLFEVSLKPPE